jgi:hypothetical protein
MSTFLLIDEAHPPQGSADTRPTVLGPDAMLRAVGIMALFGIGVIHFVQLVPTFEAMPLLGAAYLALIASSILAGVLLVKGSSPRFRQWAPVALLGVAAIAGYAFTRVVSTPLDNADVGNWSCMLGMAALYVEGLLVLIGVYAMVTRSAPRTVSVKAGDRVSATPPVLRPQTIRATSSTKSSSSTGVDVPSVSQQFLARTVTDRTLERAIPTEHQSLESKGDKSNRDLRNRNLIERGWEGG